MNFTIVEHVLCFSLNVLKQVSLTPGKLDISFHLRVAEGWTSLTTGVKFKQTIFEILGCIQYSFVSTLISIIFWILVGKKLNFSLITD